MVNPSGRIVRGAVGARYIYAVGLPLIGNRAIAAAGIGNTSYNYGSPL